MGKVEERNPDGYYVRLSEDALVQLVLAGLEAYCVDHAHDGHHRSGVETYGSLWGHQIRPGGSGPTLYCIEQVAVDTSAERARTSVHPSSAALMLKREVMSSLWPQYDFLGDIHTHPFGNHSKVLASEHGFSAIDIDDIIGHSAYWADHGYRVGMVLTISWMKRASVDPKVETLDSSTLRFTLKNVRMWLKAYVSYLAAEGTTDLEVTDESVVLDCPALTGLNLHYRPMGKVATGRKRKYVPAEGQ